MDATDPVARADATGSASLVDEGWTGDNLFEFVRGEMHNLLLDDPRLSADHLAQILARLGKKLPAA
jgi:hypothetical protein